MLNKMSKEELMVLSYTDLSELILKESTKPLNTPNIFKKVCELLELTDDDYMNQIGDFYTSLSTDKRFVFLDTNEWDLREKHPIDIVLEDEDEDFEEDEEEVQEEDPLEVDEEDVDSVIEDDLDDDSDDIDDLSILTDDELEEDE